MFEIGTLVFVIVALTLSMAAVPFFWGPNAAQDVQVLPTGIDAEELATIRLRDGTNSAQVVEAFLRALVAYNSEPAFGYGRTGRLLSLLSFPDDIDVMDELYGEMEATGATEFLEDEAQTLAEIGWMVKPRNSQIRLAWTGDYLQRRNIQQVMAALGKGFSGMRRRKLRFALMRLFQSVDYNVGSTGVSVPFAGGGSQTYYPGNTDGFPQDPSGIDHYLYADTLDADGVASILEDAYDLFAAQGKESEPTAPLILLHNSTTRAYVKAQSTYEARPSVFMNLQASNYAALGDWSALAHGVITDYDILCVEHRGVPDNTDNSGSYLGVFKSFGQNSSLNPMVRWFPRPIQPAEGAIPYNINFNPSVNISPMTDVTVREHFGFMVNDRGSGVVGYMAADASEFVSPEDSEFGI